MQIIKNGAIFISDSHLNMDKIAFLDFLKKLENGEISCKQLFLMGDIFDFLTCTKYTQIFYKNEIDLLNKLSKNIEIYYFEGNHDFNLSQIFPDIQIFPIQNQPAIFKTTNNKTIALAHGDIFLGFLDTIFLRFLRLKPFLKFMDFLDFLFKFKITKSILSKQNSKKIDYKIPNFDNYAKKRLGNYSSDIVIEGHYHQGAKFENSGKIYINLPCFASNQRFFIVEYKDDIEFIERSLRSKDV